jgi:uncharacterized protein (TIGR00255 family)
LIRSMTGFGRARFEAPGGPFEVELRSVNHRYLDVRVRLPRVLAVLEGEVRTHLQGRFDRGKVDVSVQVPASATAAPQLEVDLEVVRGYLEAAATLRDRHGLEGDLDVEDLLALPGVARFAEREPEVEALREPLLAHIDASAEAADAMRRAEGEALAHELEARLNGVVSLCEQLEGRAGEVQVSVRDRLRKRSEALAQETGVRDDGRLQYEIVQAADRLDITEETVRLRSHVEQFSAALAEAGPGEPVGRRLDFLLQEFSREANTIGSKGSDAPIAHLVVALKTQLERMREQVQNVE